MNMIYNITNSDISKGIWYGFMNIEDICTFLAVYKYGGISQAAASLYIAQSTVSQRIRRLEQEAGGELLERKPGIKGVRLTPRGESFLPIAQKAEALSSEISDLSVHAPAVSLAVGSTTSVYDAILPELFCTLAAEQPGIRLSGLARRSVELYKMVQDRSIDMAFVSFEMSSVDIDCMPVFREQYYLAASPGLISSDKPVHMASLDYSRELFYSFSADFRKWHEQMAPLGSYPMMQTDTLAFYARIAGKVPFWSICTASWVNILLKMGIPVDVFSLYAPPAPRITYLIRKKNLPASAAGAEALFEKALHRLQSAERKYAIT